MNGVIRIGNKRKGGVGPRKGETVIHVDRSSPLGNRHILKNIWDDKERQSVIQLFKKDFEEDLINNGPMSHVVGRIVDRVKEGKDVILMCWCFGPPTNKSCHAEVIKEKIEQLLNE